MDRKSKLFISASVFFFFTFSVLFVLFLRWLLIAPFIFENVLYLVLLIFYATSIAIFRLQKSRLIVQATLLPLSILLFLANCWCLLAYSPIVNDAAICNRSLYYISHFNPFGDMQWTEYRYTKWSGFMHYETRFYGYEYGPYEIVCDNEQGETNIIRQIYEPGFLVYIDGKRDVQLNKYIHTHTNKHTYSLSQEFSDCDHHSCTITYTLYVCNFDYKTCHPLPIEFTDTYEEPNHLSADDITGEITLYSLNDEKIFTYGKHPRCYMQGCKILEENNP